MPKVKTRASSTIVALKKLVTTAMLYASKSVKPLKNRRLAGYDFRFQNVRSMNPIAPKREIHIIH